MEEVWKWGGGGREGCTLNSISVGHFLWHIWPNAPEKCKVSVAHGAICATESGHLVGPTDISVAH